jgi:hypothetical protein
MSVELTIFKSGDRIADAVEAEALDASKKAAVRLIDANALTMD